MNGTHLHIEEETIEDLEKKFNEIERKNPREAAEVAFAIASYYHKTDRAKAKAFAQKSISLFEQCEMKTYEQCMAMDSFICGIIIPDLIHEDVVKSRFADLLQT